MILAEWKKLLHNGAFRIFLFLFLIAGALSPLITGLDRTTPALYKAYEGMSTDEVLADIELRQRNLEIVRTLELNAMLPPEIAQTLLESLVTEYGLTEAEMEAIDPESCLRFTEDAHSESELLQRVKSQAERVTGYSPYLQSIREQEQTIQNSILYRNNPYALILARKTAEEYADLDGLTLPLADPTGVEILLGTWIDDALLCAIAALTAMYCFLQERQEGVIPLLFSTKRGRRATYLAKISLIAIVGAASCVLFALFRMGYAGDLGDLSRPVQTIPAFYTSPYRISVGAMLIWNLMQRMAATVFTGIAMSLLCIALERSLALGAAALLVLVEVLCWAMIDSASILQPVKYLSVPALFSGQTMIGNAVFVKLLGIPVNFVHTSLFLLIAGGGGIATLGSWFYTHSHKTISLPVLTKRERTKKIIPGLFLLEFHKLMFHQKGALLLLLVLALQPRFYDSMHARITTDELRYLSVVKSVEGVYTAEKQESLENQRDELNAQLAQTADPLMQDELSARLTAVEQVISLGSYLSTREEPVAFVYETGFEAMFGLRPVGARYQNWLITISLCLILPSLFTLDRETGIHNLIQTTAGIRKLRKTKYRIAFLIATLIFLICWLPEAKFITRAFDLSQWTAPVVSMQAFLSYPGVAPVWLAVLGLWLFRFAAALGAGFTVSAIAERVTASDQCHACGLLLCSSWVSCAPWGCSSRSDRGRSSSQPSRGRRRRACIPRRCSSCSGGSRP